MCCTSGWATRWRRAPIDLGDLEPGLRATLDVTQACRALAGDSARIVAAADETLARAQVTAQGVEVLYLTGGSTGWQPLVQALQARLPAARVMRGDRFASVARGLGLHARRLYGAAA